MNTCRACSYNNNRPRRAMFNTDSICKARAKEEELNNKIRQLLKKKRRKLNSYFHEKERAMKKSETKLEKAKENFIDKLYTYLEIRIGCTTYTEIRKEINKLIELAKQEAIEEQR